MKTGMAFIIALVISGCGYKEIKPINDALNQDQLKVSSSDTCSIYDSRNWHAWVDQPSQKTNRYRLNIAGVVDLPSPNYEVSWTMGLTDRANPPIQHLAISTRNKAEGATIQVITPTRIELKQETPLSTYRAVKIFCSNRLLTTIHDVGLTD